MPRDGVTLGELLELKIGPQGSPAGKSSLRALAAKYNVEGLFEGVNGNNSGEAAPADVKVLHKAISGGGRSLKQPHPPPAGPKYSRVQTPIARHLSPDEHTDDDGDHDAESDGLKIKSGELKSPKYNSGHSQAETWDAHKGRDAYTGWVSDQFHDCRALGYAEGAPWQVDHILELQLIASCATVALHRDGSVTRDSLSARVLALLKDHVANEATLNLNITCAKVNQFKGQVFKSLIGHKHGVKEDFDTLVQLRNETYSRRPHLRTNARGPFFDSPVIAEMIEASSKAAVIGDVIGCMKDEMLAAQDRVTSAMLSLSAASERAVASKILSELQVRLEAWGISA